MVRFMPSWSVVFSSICPIPQYVSVVIPRGSGFSYIETGSVRTLARRIEKETIGNTVPCSLTQQTVLLQIIPSERPEVQQNHTVFRFLKRPPLVRMARIPFSVMVRWRLGNDYQIRALLNPHLHKVLAVLAKVEKGLIAQNKSIIGTEQVSRPLILDDACSSCPGSLQLPFTKVAESFDQTCGTQYPFPTHVPPGGLSVSKFKRGRSMQNVQSSSSNRVYLWRVELHIRTHSPDLGDTLSAGQKGF